MNKRRTILFWHVRNMVLYKLRAKINSLVRLKTKRMEN